jgi:serine/threonine protein kinase
MSPEQALGQPVDGRSDLFSLGSMAYMMLTGVQAFSADNVFQVLARVTQEQPLPPSQVNPALPPEVDLFMKRALAKSPNLRYQDGETMASEIEDLLEGRLLPLWTTPEGDLDHPLVELIDDPLATRPSPPKPAPTTAARWRWEPFAAALALAIGAAALVTALRREHPPAPPPAATAPAPATAPEASPSVAAAEPVKPSLRPAPSPAASSGRLAIDFEHHLKSGRLRIWVDSDLVLEEELDSHVTKKILTFPVRKGSVTQTLEVPSGSRQVKVQVRWDDNIKTETARTTFRAGVTRRLEIRVSRLLGGLSLRWK